MVTRTPKQTQAALREAARLSGLSRNVIAAQKRNMKTFLDEAEGKEKAAVTREDMTKVGLNFKKSGDLTKYLNMQNKKGRKPIEDDFRTTIKAKDKSDVPLVSPSVKKDKPKKSTRGGKVVISGGRASGSTTTDKEIKPSNKKEKDVDSILTKGANFIKENPALLISLVPIGVGGLAVGGGLALGRGLTKYIIRKHGKQALNKVKSEIKKAAKKKSKSKKVTKGKVVSKTPMGPAAPKGRVVSKTPMGPATPRGKVVSKTPMGPKNKPKELSVQETLARIPSLKKTPAKTDAGPKLTQVQQLYKKFKNNPKGINNAIDKLAISPSAKAKLRQQVQTYKPSLKERTELGLKKGGLIKRSIGGALKNIPAGNKGLPKLPTAVRNKMGFKKKGGIVKRSKGGFLGAGKALRGQGAVMRKKGGKIAH